LGAGITLKEVRSKYNLSKDQVDQSLELLQRLSLIELINYDKIVLKYRGPIKVIPGGKLKTEFFPLHTKTILEQLSKASLKDSFLHVFELYLSQKTQMALEKEMKNLFIKYASLSKCDHETSNNVRACTGVFMLGPFDGWYKTLTHINMELRNKTN
jgi:hypothetical protein